MTHVYARAALVLLVVTLVHEAGHALTFALFGYPVEQFVVGLGKPWVSVTLGLTEYGISPILLGAYVSPVDDVPRLVSACAILAGPLANLAVLLLHPRSPLRHLHEIPMLGLREAITKMLDRLVDPSVDARVTLPNGATIIVSGSESSVEAVVRQLKKSNGIPDDPPPIESYLDHIPLIGSVRYARNLSFWEASAVIAVINLLPFPPLDGAHVLLLALPQTETIRAGYALLSLFVLILLFITFPLLGALALHRRRKQTM